MVFRNGLPVIVGDTPGGDRQPQWSAQVISNLLDHGMNVQGAAEAPRWEHFPGADPANLGRARKLLLETGFSPETSRELERRGHPVEEIGGTASLEATKLSGWSTRRASVWGAPTPAATVTRCPSRSSSPGWRAAARRGLDSVCRN